MNKFIKLGIWIAVSFSLFIGLSYALDETPPIITQMTPPDDSSITELPGGTHTNINFTVSCFDNVDCQNASIKIYYDNGTNFNFSENIFPSIWNLTVGTGFTGTLSDVFESDDVKLILQEEDTNDGCLEAYFNWTGGTRRLETATMTVEGYYNGGAGHIVEGSWVNRSSGVLISFFNATKETSDQIYSTGPISTEYAVGDDGVAILFLNHSDGTCLSAHDFLIDEIVGSSIAGESDSVNLSSGDTVGINIGVPLGTWLYSYTAYDTSGNSFTLGNYTFSIVPSRLMTITLTDMNLYSFNIPILNKWINPKNYIDVYENGNYISTNHTNEELHINNSCPHRISFKPSKKQLLSKPEAIINIVPSYYGIIISVIFILILLFAIFPKLRKILGI